MVLMIIMPKEIITPRHSGTMGEDNINLRRKWSQIPYPGESKAPQGVDPSAGSWPMHFFRKNEYGAFTTFDGKPVSFEILQPSNINFDKSHLVVKNVLENLSQNQRVVAEYWGSGPPTKQWTPIIDRLISTYGLSPVRAARVLAAVQAGINDAIIITWHFKYLWDVPRPNQLDKKLTTVINTPKFPTYPSGHSVISATAEVILSYFFPPEAERLRELAGEDSMSRLYAGIHFKEDLLEGTRLGHQIGRIIVHELSKQRDINQIMIDIPITQERHANLPPPPYEQVI
jgi:hypothetical protein